MSDDGWPPGFFDRQDRGDDADFYVPPRLVTHIDDGAIAAVSELYDELGVPDGRVLDLMSSWVSHLSRKPSGGLIALGMNAVELQANPVADQVVVQDLNLDPRLPFDDASLDAVVCCVSIDYLINPVEVLREAARVLRPHGVVVLTFSNRCFPTKAVRGWLATDEEGRVAIVRAYLEQAGCCQTGWRSRWSVSAERVSSNLLAWTNRRLSRYSAAVSPSSAGSAACWLAGQSPVTPMSED